MKKLLLTASALAIGCALAPDGTLLGQRILLHPHVDEQPFTRDLYGVAVPEGVAEVTVRARHKPKGYDGAVMTVPLPR